MSTTASVFIDGNYLNAILDDLGRPKVDLGRLGRKLSGNTNLLRIYYYLCAYSMQDAGSREDEERVFKQEGFFNALRNIPNLELRLGYLARLPKEESDQCVLAEKGADVLLAVDMLRSAILNQIDKAFLVAGEEAFIPVVRAVKELGVQVHLFHDPGRMEKVSMGLFEACDIRTALDMKTLQGCLM